MAARARRRRRICPGASTASRRCTSPRDAGTWRWSSCCCVTVRTPAAPQRWPHAAHAGGTAWQSRHRRASAGPGRAGRTVAARSIRRRLRTGGSRAAAARCWRRSPHCARELRPDHHLLLHRPAESGDAPCSRRCWRRLRSGRARPGQRHAAASRRHGRPSGCHAGAARARRRYQRPRRHVRRVAAGVGRRGAQSCRARRRSRRPSPAS